MELPQGLRAAVDKQLYDADVKQIITRAAQLSRRYRERERDGAAYIADDTEALAYMLARMPATYGAVYAALRETSMAMEMTETFPALTTLLDVGAGTGAAAWAADTLLPMDTITCIEASAAMRRLGQALMAEGALALINARWLAADITKTPPDNSGTPPDLVIASYILNELPDDARMKTAQFLWESAGQVLLLVEPGTPEGFRLLKNIREALSAAGAHTLAPCPNNHPCPLPEGDWCHFAERIPRSRAHKQAKDGDAPFEDEKFAYLALSKTPPVRGGARILRHPSHRKGHTLLSLCTADGIREETVTRKDGNSYAHARKCAWGGLYHPPAR